MEFYGYKKCSTCRNAYKFLTEHGIELEFHDFVEQPPAPDRLRTWIAGRGQGVAPFLNVKGTRFKELGLKDRTLSEDDWIERLSQDGRLLKRPVLVTDNGVIIGFDKSAYETIAKRGMTS